MPLFNRRSPVLSGGTESRGLEAVVNGPNLTELFDEAGEHIFVPSETADRWTEKGFRRTPALIDDVASQLPVLLSAVGESYKTFVAEVQQQGAINHAGASLVAARVALDELLKVVGSLERSVQITFPNREPVAVPLKDNTGAVIAVDPNQVEEFIQRGFTR